MKKQNLFYFGICLSLILILLILLSLSIGDSSFSIHVVWDCLFGKASPAMTFIITKIRLPRILACLFGGASLALAGNLLQTLTRNPLADSGILGINAGAGFMIALLISLGKGDNSLNMAFLPFLATLGALLTLVLVYMASLSKQKTIQPTALIITGVGFSMMLSSLMIAVVGHVNRYKVDYVLNWLSGRIIGDDWNAILLTAPLLVLLWGFTYSKSYTLNILLLSDDMATALGMNVQRERKIILALATCLAAISVTLIGNITFIGLIAGHVSRYFIGDDHRLNLPLSLLLGMIFLLLADTLTRVFLVGSNIPTGIIISLLGAPYFLYLMQEKPKKS